MMGRRLSCLVIIFFRRLEFVLEVLVPQMLYFAIIARNNQYILQAQSFDIFLQNDNDDYLQGTKEWKCSSSRIVTFPSSQGKTLFCRHPLSPWFSWKHFLFRKKQWIQNLITFEGLSEVLVGKNNSRAEEGLLLIQFW